MTTEILNQPSDAVAEKICRSLIIVNRIAKASPCQWRSEFTHGFVQAEANALNKVLSDCATQKGYSPPPPMSVSEAVDYAEWVVVFKSGKL